MTKSTPPPPLDIIAYHIDEFAFRALDEFEGEREGAGTFSIDFNHEQNENDPRHFRIVMEIRFAEHGYKAEENPPYSITLKLTGYFGFVEGTPDKVLHRMIDVNGSSILFGIARGFVGQVTSAAKNGQFLLPPVNFIALVNARREAKAKTIPPPDAADNPRELPPATTDAVEKR